MPNECVACSNVLNPKQLEMLKDFELKDCIRHKRLAPE